MIESRCCRTYYCVACDKAAAELSTSWSTVTFPDRTHLHRCLECRTSSKITSELS